MDVQGAPAVDLARRHSSAAARAAAAAAETAALSLEDGDDAAPNRSTTVASTYLYRFRRPEHAAAGRRADVALRVGGLDDDLAYAFGAPLVALSDPGGRGHSTAAARGIDPFTDSSFTRLDRELSETVMNYWINFIRTGCVVLACGLLPLPLILNTARPAYESQHSGAKCSASVSYLFFFKFLI